MLEDIPRSDGAIKVIKTRDRTSPFRIKRVDQCQVCKVCEHACPTGAIRSHEIDFKECVRCDICEVKLIEKSGVCKHSVEDLKSRMKDWQPITVS